MSLKHQFNFIGIVMVVSILACQSTNNPVSDMGMESTIAGFKTKYPPTITSFAPTTSIEGNLYAKLPPNFLADPNTACAIHGRYHPSNENALSCLDNTGWHIYTQADFKYPLSIPDQMVQCSDGSIYLTIGNILYLLEGDTMVDVTTGGIEFIYSSEFLACGSGNKVWVGEGGGVSLFDGSTWTNYPVEEIFSDSDRETGFYINSMVVDPNGDVWIAAYDTIATFDGTNWKIFAAGNGFASTTPIITMLAVDGNGIIWALGNVILKYEDTQWSTYPIPEDSGELRFITIDKENAVWVGSFGGTIYTIDSQSNGSGLQFNKQASLDRYIDDMHFDGQSHLWVVTEYGLEVFDGFEWITYRMDTADLYENTADAIAILGDGPHLLAPASKTPGSVHGKLVNPDPAMYANMQVEICVADLHYQTFTGKTPCSFQKYHALTTVNADGSFQFEGIRVGKYYLLIQDSSISWFSMGEFEVKPGALFEFGDIVFPSE